MSLERDSLAFVRHLQEQFFEKGNTGLLAEAATPLTSWIYTGANEIFHNLEDGIAALRFAQEANPTTFTITEDALSPNAPHIRELLKHQYHVILGV